MTKNNFNLLAPYYDHLSAIVFGDRILRAQEDCLSVIGHSRTILVVGGGTGSILKVLLERFPQAAIYYLEPSKAMIQRAKARVAGKKHQISFIQSRIEQQPLRKQYFDLVITPFVLDVFDETELPRVMDKLYRTLSLNGYWVQADFYPSKPRLWWQLLLLSSMQIFFRLSAGLQIHRLPEFDQYFNSYSLREKYRTHYFGNIIEAVCYQNLTP